MVKTEERREDMNTHSNLFLFWFSMLFSYTKKEYKTIKIIHHAKHIQLKIDA